MDTGFPTVLWCLCFRSGFGGRQANPGWGLGCVCLGTGFAFAPPILARVCGARVLAPVVFGPPQFWLGCWGLCVGARAPLVPCQSWLGFPVRPASPGWGVGVCVFVCALRLYPANPRWSSPCVCLGSGFGFHPANPGFGVGVCAFVCALDFYPANLGSGVRWGCVCLGSGFQLPPAIPGLSFQVCVFVCALRPYSASSG